MKTSSLMPILVGALMTLSVVSAWLSVRYFFSLKELQDLQAQHFRAQRTMAAVRALAGQCVQYGKSNPAIHPILQQFNLSAGTNELSGLSPETPGVPLP